MRPLFRVLRGLVGVGCNLEPTHQPHEFREGTRTKLIHHLGAMRLSECRGSNWVR